MDDIREHTDDKQLRELIDKYYDEHTGLSVDCRDMPVSYTHLDDIH